MLAGSGLPLAKRDAYLRRVWLDLRRQFVDGDVVV
jgi:hypothetical protein